LSCHLATPDWSLRSEAELDTVGAAIFQKSTKTQYSSALKVLFTAIGKSHYSTHLIRRSAAMWAGQCGADMLCIRNLGRWVSIKNLALALDTPQRTRVPALPVASFHLLPNANPLHLLDSGRRTRLRRLVAISLKTILCPKPPFLLRAFSPCVEMAYLTMCSSALRLKVSGLKICLPLPWCRNCLLSRKRRTSTFESCVGGSLVDDRSTGAVPASVVRVLVVLIQLVVVVVSRSVAIILYSFIYVRYH